MTNFIYDNTGLPTGKFNLAPIPTGALPAQWLAANEWATVMQAMLDTQAWARGANWMGFVPLAADPAPAGVANYVWLRNDNTWMHNDTPLGGGGGGVTQVNTGTGLTGGPITGTGTVALADTAVTPGAYTAPTLMVDQQGRITAIVSNSIVSPTRMLIAGTGLVGGGDLSADRTFALANTAVTPGAYTNANLTIDQQGRITAAADGTAGIDGITVATVTSPTPLPTAGSAFIGIVITPDGLHGYVGNGGGIPAYVFRTSDNKYTATVAVGTWPEVVAIKPDGTRVYTANNNSNDVSVVDTSTNTVVATVSGIASPFGIAVTPDGSTVYVSSYTSSQIYRIDTATNTLIGLPIVVNASPSQIGINPAGTKAYVNVINGVDIISTTTNLVIAHVTTGGSGNGGFVFKSDSSVVYTVDGSDVVAIDGVTNTLIASYGPIGSIVGTPSITPDNAKIYFPKIDGSVDVWSTSTLNVITNIPGVGTYVRSSAINPAGTSVYVTSFDNSTMPFVTVIDTSTDTISGVVNSSAPGSPTVLGPFQQMTFPGSTITDLGGGEVQVAPPASVFVVDAGAGSAVQNNGTGNAAAAIDSIAMGNGSSCPNSAATGSFACGQGNSGGNYSAAVGSGTANGDNSMVTGGGFTSGVYGFATHQGQAANDYAMAIGGYGSIASGPASSGIGGFGQNASGEGATAIGGYGAGAEGVASVALNESLTQGENSLAGNDGWATGYGSFSACGGQAAGQYAASVGEAYADGDDAWGTGVLGNATRTAQRTHASGCFQALSNATQRASAQESTLVMRGQTPGAGAGETVELYFNRDSSNTPLYFSLEDDKCYLIEISAVANGLVSAALNVQTFKRRYAVRRTAGLTTIAAMNALEQLGDAASASWTLTASVLAGPDRFALTLSTGTTTTSARVVAKISFTEVLLAS